MKTRTALALIVAGTIGIGASLLQKRPYSREYEKARSQIPAEAFQAEEELGNRLRNAETSQNVINRIFESQENQKKFEDLYFRVKGFRNSPEIRAAQKKMDDLSTPLSVYNTLIVLSIFPAGIWAGLDYMERKKLNCWF